MNVSEKTCGLAGEPWSINRFGQHIPNVWPCEQILHAHDCLDIVDDELVHWAAWHQVWVLPIQYVGYVG